MDTEYPYHWVPCALGDKFPGAGGSGGRSGGHCHRVVQTPVSCHHRSEGRRGAAIHGVLVDFTQPKTGISSTRHDLEI